MIRRRRESEQKADSSSRHLRKSSQHIFILTPLASCIFMEPRQVDGDSQHSEGRLHACRTPTCLMVRSSGCSSIHVKLTISLSHSFTMAIQCTHGALLVIVSRVSPTMIFLLALLPLSSKNPVGRRGVGLPTGCHASLGRRTDDGRAS